MDNNNDQNFQAITETNIKGKSGRGKGKLRRKILTSILCGLIFGVTACISFGIFYEFYFRDNISTDVAAQLEKKNHDRLSLNNAGKDTKENDDAPDTDQGSAGDENTDVSAEENAGEENKSEAEVTSEVSAESGSGASGDSGSNDFTIPDEPRQIYITEEHTLTPEEYQVLYNKMIYSGTVANRSIVTVYSEKKLTDIFDMDYENSSTSEGLIIAEDGGDILILTQNGFLKNTRDIFIQIKNEYLPAELLGESDSFGIAVLRCDVSGIDESEAESFEVGNVMLSGSAYTGKFVLALGSSRGISGEIVLGAISSVKPEVGVMDANIPVMVTDISGNSQSGFMTDISGQFIGMFLPDITGSVTKDKVCAVSLGGMQPVIEKLMNGENIMTLGLTLSDTANAKAVGYSLPEGIFVRNVEVDSPAFDAGIRPGDIITAVNGEDIGSIEEWKEVLYAADENASLSLTVERSDGEEYEALLITINGEDEEKQ